MIRLQEKNFQEIIQLRRELHQFPELSNEEEKTSGRIEAALNARGLRCESGIGGHGIVCDIPGRREDRVVALRADIDALPVHEETGLPFSSKNAGVMHACGHDGHTSMLFGAATILQQQDLPVTVRLIWQPAEELASGARAMIAAGVMKNVRMIFGGHVDRRYKAGTLVITDGPVNASTDMFKIEIEGQQGHGARPHEAIDAVVVGSLLVTALQTIVSREVDPAHPSVVTIGRFDAGTAANVIAGRARLEGTIRAQYRETRQHLMKSIERIAKAIGQLHEASVSVEFTPGTLPVVNEGRAVEIARKAAIELVGADNVFPLHVANMGGEDFAYYLEHAEGCYIRYGAMIEGKEGFPAHSSRFDFDESAIRTGAEWLAAVAIRASEVIANETD